jgi:hypothetical protein
MAATPSGTFDPDPPETGGPPPDADPFAPPASPDHVPGRTPTGGRGPFGEQQLPPEEPAAPDTAPTRGGGGCGTPVMIGCGVLLVLLGIAAVVFVLNAGRFLGTMYEFMGKEAVKNLPEDIPAADRARLEAAFAAIAEGARDGTLDGRRVMGAQQDLQELVETPQDEVTVEQVRELAESLERAAGMEPGEPDPDPPGQGAEPGEIRGPPPEGE